MAPLLKFVPVESEHFFFDILNLHIPTSINHEAIDIVFHVFIVHVPMEEVGIFIPIDRPSDSRFFALDPGLQVSPAPEFFVAHSSFPIFQM